MHKACLCALFACFFNNHRSCDIDSRVELSNNLISLFVPFIIPVLGMCMYFTTVVQCGTTVVVCHL